ncbi:MAG: DUF530 family protein [Euryarchaeota archaeon]|nr:DUF530 family protein [Euryarchaeota archaeon]
MSLTYKVNNFLDSLEYSFEREGLRDKECFKDLYFQFLDNLSILENLKEKMDFYGFQNPYYPLKGLKGSEYSFRKRAQLKKSTYERNSYAISAHKIAVGHLEESIMLKNDKTYRGKDAVKHLNRKLKLCKNEEGVYRFEILENIPLSGDYMVKLGNFTPQERKNYRGISKFLDNRKSKLSSVSIYMKRNSGTKKRNLSLKEYRSSIKNKKKIKSFKLHKKKRGLLKSSYIRKILSISYAPLGKDAFIFDLAMFYLKKGKYERERYAGIFPSLSRDIPMEKFGEYREIIEAKEKIEEKLHTLGKYEKSFVVGAVVYYTVTDNIERTLRYFGIKRKTLEKKLEEFRSLGVIGSKDLQPKTREFLKHLRR